MVEPRMQFGNFICHFGEWVLSDFLPEIVVPSFTDDSLVREYADTSYFFYETKLIRLREAEEGFPPVLALRGRFVKSSTLHRSHIFENILGLIEDAAAMESAAFAFFVLILNSHKLLYLPETAYPPTLSNFAATAAHHFRLKRQSFIDREYIHLREAGEKITKKSLHEWLPKPRVECIPLASRDSIEKFLSHYEKLQLIQFNLLEPNQEISGSRIWEKLREMKREVNASDTALVHKSKGGLNIKQAQEQLHDAAATGNQTVRLNGLDHEGNILRGNNTSFQYTVDMPDLPIDDDERAESMYEEFEDLIDTEALSIDENEDADAADKIRDLDSEI